MTAWRVAVLGDFGRTPKINESAGRDHWPQVSCALMAGGGMRTGQVIGATDDLGYNAVENPVHVNDVHATILYCLGLDHLDLTYLHNGRHERATVNGGKVVKAILA